MENIFDITLDGVLEVMLSCIIIYVAVILFTRIFGLRSFAKMSGFDFAKTVAIGSMIGSVATTNSTIVQGVIATGILFILHHLVAEFRKFTPIKEVIDNSPLLLMYNGKLLRDNMVSAEMEEDDIRSKLREAGVLNYQEVKAVVMETTGKISVMHTNDEKKDFDVNLLKNVRGVPERYVLPQRLERDMPKFERPVLQKM